MTIDPNTIGDDGSMPLGLLVQIARHESGGYRVVTGLIKRPTPHFVHLFPTAADALEYLSAALRGPASLVMTKAEEN